MRASFKWLTSIAGIAAIFIASISAAQDGGPYRLVFSKADVGSVLKAISLRSGAKIIFSNGEAGAKLVSLDVTVNSAEEGIRAAVSSAGLAFRRVGSIYIVADSSRMKSALAPYAVQAKFALTAMSADDAATFLEKAVPTVSARGAGSRVLVIGIPEDLLIARDLLAEREAQLQAEESVGRVANLKYASSDMAAKMLQTLYPRLKVSASGQLGQQGGSIAFSGSAEEVDLALKAIAEFDVPAFVPQPDLDFKVYEVKYSSAVVLQQFLKEALPDVQSFVGPEAYSPPQPTFFGRQGQGPLGGGSLSQQANVSGGGSGSGGQGSGQGSAGSGSAPLQIQPTQRAKEGDRAKHLVLRGPSLLVEAALAMLSRVDIRPIQVQVEVKVIDVSPEKLVEAGFDYSWSPFTAIETPAGTPFTGTLPPTGKIDINASGLPTKLGFGAFSRIPWRIDAILNGLITKKEAKLLASPNIVVVDNDDATIFIGDTLRVLVAQGGGIAGTTIQVEEFPVGIALLLRPRVNTDNNITMRVHPVVSSVTSIGANNLPQTSTREAETTLVLRDGETVILGGLIRDEMMKTVREVPFLADIPILGELFKSRTTSSKRSDVLVLITTRILKENVSSVKPGVLSGKPGGLK